MAKRREVTSEAMREKSRNATAPWPASPAACRTVRRRRVPSPTGAAPADGAPKPADDGARKNAAPRASTRMTAASRRSSATAAQHPEKLSVAVVLNSAAAPRTRKRAGPRPSWRISKRCCVAAWASTPSAATAEPDGAGLPRQAARGPMVGRARYRRRLQQLAAVCARCRPRLFPDPAPAAPADDAPGATGTEAAGPCAGPGRQCRERQRHGAWVAWPPPMAPPACPHWA